ncbi:MAG: hypothetical protein AAI946_00825 [Candidatus Hodgkinia cicadicola]
MQSAPPKLLAYAVAAAALMLGFEVRLTTVMLMVMTDVISAALLYTAYVLTITSECRFRLRLLATAPAIAPLAWYVVHDLVIPPECYYGISEPKVLTQAHWPIPSVRLARLII